MEGRIDQTDDHWESLHRFQDAEEVLLLQPTELFQGTKIAAGEISEHRF